ncbi:SRPBCC domain-containing protein [Nocardia brevicatena]|uniref:SRPBCC domain-containing protein n=1 Tax=Nocardia brevicatena TaxID=37327 RepID=UPI000315B132|nr:SRPBCC domain-containing protein [Nocardia brevicatena]
MSTTTRIEWDITVSPDAGYRALVDGEAVPIWMVPTGVTGRAHEFGACEGGRFGISLPYDDPASAGKSGGATDTRHGRFEKPVAGAQVVQTIEFETDDPQVAGVMLITYTLTGTRLCAEHDGVSDGVRPEDNELGWRISLGKPTALVEGRAIPA